MAGTLVMKFGGTSLRDEVARAAAVAHVRRQAESGRSVAVVVSAMGRRGEPYATDTLIGLLRAAGEPVPARELDLAMSVGEILSAAYFAHLLNLAGLPARAYTGPQAGFITDDTPGHAEILDLRPERIRACFADGCVAVVAGFQGATEGGEIRTLGRGGSDTSAVALGAALGAEEVEIYTDVDGIACADPRRVPEAPFLDEIGARQVLAMAEEGSQVLHPRAVRASLATRTPLRVRNTFSEQPGTLVAQREESGPARPVALAHRDRQVLLRAPTTAGGKPSPDPDALVPELLALGGDRYLLPDDVYLEERIALLKSRFPGLSAEPGWATASVIYAGPVHAAVPPLAELDQGVGEGMPPPPPHEVLDQRAPAAYRRLLAREEHLDALLGLLYERTLR